MRKNIVALTFVLILIATVAYAFSVTPQSSTKVYGPFGTNVRSAYVAVSKDAWGVAYVEKNEDDYHVVANGKKFGPYPSQFFQDFQVSDKEWGFIYRPNEPGARGYHAVINGKSISNYGKTLIISNRGQVLQVSFLSPEATAKDGLVQAYLKEGKLYFEVKKERR